MVDRGRKPREIHIAPYSSVGGRIRHALKLQRNACIDNKDNLSDGPLPRCRSLARWLKVRDRYWNALNVDPRLRGFGFISESELFARIEDLQEADQITLWIGTSTDEQLLLAWMVRFFRFVHIDPLRLGVIQFDHAAVNWTAPIPLGCLNAAQLGAHPPAVRLSQEDVAEIDEVWSAVTAPDPATLVALAAGPSGSLRFLSRSLRVLILRYPGLTTGLNRCEEDLLKCTRDKGPKSAAIVGTTMGNAMDYGDIVGSDYLFARLRRLADSKLSHPLLHLTGSGIKMRDTAFTLTPWGERVLAGDANFVDLNGIDDWVGGVHLQSSKGNVWFRRGEVLVRG